MNQKEITPSALHMAKKSCASHHRTWDAGGVSKFACPPLVVFHKNSRRVLRSKMRCAHRSTHPPERCTSSLTLTHTHIQSDPKSARRALRELAYGCDIILQRRHLHNRAARVFLFGFLRSWGRRCRRHRRRRRRRQRAAESWTFLSAM